ncbi:MAG: Alkyl hydroperoxide reductase C [Candidatus Westeberhardia cardiocondylae]|nr:Alkyl hydroperoxide reductase C [Candidatus Westeberhardia cardiocondylae]
MLLITRKSPDFTAPAIMGNGDIKENFNLKTFIKNKSAIIFFWPLDFTFVCPTEIITFNRRYKEFKEKQVEIIGISCDSVFAHQQWRLMPINDGGIGMIQFPMISDITRKIIQSYDVEHPSIGVAFRASFLIDKKRIIRHQIVNDLPFGRNIDEMMRMVDAMQFHEKHGEVCPAQWKKGNQGIHMTRENTAKYLSENF